MADVFISYSRKDKEFVQVLHQALTESKYDAWIDWEDILPTADWWAEIEAGIEAADAFLFVISPDSVASRVCNREIDCAVANHKRLVPIVRRGGFTSAEIHRALSKHNWLYFRSEDEFEQAFSELVGALNTDLDHVKNHTQLLVRSQEWLHKKQNSDLLLRGSQLDATLTWITASADQEPRLTQGQREYVAASSKAERDRQAAEIQRQQQELRRQRIWLGLVGAAFLVASGLGGLAFSQFRVAEARRKQVEYSQIETLASSAEAFLNANQGLDGLIYGLKAARQLAQMEKVPDRTKFQVIVALQQALYKTPDRARLVGHNSAIWYATLSPDDQLIASASHDTTAKLWDLDGNELATFKGHSKPITWVAISPDNRLIATASEDATVKLWTSEGKLLRTLDGHKEDLRSVAFTPDGQQIVSASIDGTVKFWNLEGRILKTLEAHTRTCNASFSPDGKLLLTFSCGDEIKLWSPTGDLLKTFSADTGIITRVAFSPDSQKIATATMEGEITFWLANGQKIQTVEGHQQDIWGLEFSADGQTVYSAGEDSTFKFWTSEGELTQTLTGFNPAISSIDANAAGDRLILGDRSGAVRIWELSPQPLHKSEPTTTISFSPDNQTLLTGNNSGILRLRTTDGTPLSTLGRYNYAITGISFTPDGHAIQVSSLDGAVHQLTLDGQPIKTWPQEFSGGTFTQVSPKGDLIARGNNAGQIEIETTSGEKLASFQAHDQGFNSLVFSPDGTKLASASYGDHLAKVWSLKGELLATLTGHQSDVIEIAFSPDSDRIVSSSADRTLKLWSVTGQELATLEGHKAVASAIAFSPDGKLLASAGQDNTIRLWTADGQELATLQGQPSAINELAFNPQSSILVSADVAGRLTFWSLNLEDLIIQTCHEFRHYLSTSPTLTEADRRLCQGVEPDWLAEGKDLAAKGDVNGAVEKFKVALQRQPDLNFEPLLKAKQIAAAVPLNQAEKLTTQLRLPEAIKAYKQALSLYPELGFDPATHARQEVAHAMLSQADTLLIGKVTLQELDQAIALFNQAKPLNADVSGRLWVLNNLCWGGSLYNYAAQVIDFCEEAVTLAANDPYVRDSRGLARALTGDVNGAIDDFQFYIDKIFGEDEKEDRQRWITALKAGQNPFTPKELESLR